MSCVVDNLAVYCRVRVRQDFTDARGTRVCAGDSAVIQAIDLDWARQEIVIEWKHRDAATTLYFSLAATTGPRNGRMREFFDVEGREFPPRPAPEYRRSRPAARAEVVESPDASAMSYDDGLACVQELASQRRFAEADALIRAFLHGPQGPGGLLEQMAGDLGTIALAYAADDPVCPWAREWATNLWYSWGSNASSGGEGAARVHVIDAAMERLNRHRDGERSGPIGHGPAGP